MLLAFGDLTLIFQDLPGNNGSVRDSFGICSGFVRDFFGDFRHLKVNARLTRDFEI